MSRAWRHAPDVLLPNGRPAVGPWVGGIVDSLSRHLVPNGGDLPVDLDETNAHLFLARYFADLEPGTRFGLKAMLIAFDLLPILFIGRLSRFVHLYPGEQDLYLKDWEASRLYHRRMLVVLLKTLVGMGFYNDPKTLAAIGFKLPCEAKGGAR